MEENTNWYAGIVGGVIHIRWRIRNVSSLAESTSIFSPVFILDPKRFMEWRLEILFSNSDHHSELSISLVNSETRLVRLSKANLKCNMKVYNTDGDVWQETTVIFQHRDISRRCLVVISSKHRLPINIADEFPLPGDTLAIKCAISLRDFISVTDNQRELAADFKKLYAEVYKGEVIFRFGERTLKAHKFILTTRSPFFASVLSNEMQDNRQCYFEIRDISYEVFKYFIVYLYYADILNTNVDIVSGLYFAARKFHVNCLRKACLSILTCKITLVTVCKILILSDNYAEEKLKAACKHYIFQNFAHFAVMNDWKELISSHPTLSSEVLNYITCNASENDEAQNTVHP